MHHVLQDMVINDSKHLLPAGWSSAYPEAVSLLAASTELGLPELPVDSRGLSTVTTGDEEPPSSRTSSALINTDGSALFTENLLAILIERRLLPRPPQTVVCQLSQNNTKRTIQQHHRRQTPRQWRADSTQPRCELVKCCYRIYMACQVAPYGAWPPPWAWPLVALQSGSS